MGIIVDRGGYKDTFFRVFDILDQRALEDSANYIEQFIGNVVLLREESQEELYKMAMNTANDSGLFLEFGVFTGGSLNMLSDLRKDVVWYGFDNFTGLVEDWKGGMFPKGYFNQDGRLPKVNANVQLVVGDFDQTLPNFIACQNDKVSFINIDCDTYESCKYVLDTIGCERLNDNCLIIFDEYIGYPGWKHNEFKAWKEFTQKNNVKYEYLAFNTTQALIKIKK